MRLHKAMVRPMAALACVAGLYGAACADGLKAETRVIEVKRIDVPPAIDGVLNDPCWTAAAVAADFRCLSLGGQPGLAPAPDATTVLAVYDAEALYIAYTCHDGDWSSFKKSFIPGWSRDCWTGGGDEIEVFLDPGATGGKRYFQLAVSAANESFDQLVKGLSDGFWSSGWTSATRIDSEKQQYTVELRLPFRELCAVGEGGGTPADGAVWTGNFCRNRPGRGYAKGNTGWSNGAFHAPALWGTLRFVDPLKRPAITAQDTEQLQWGRGAAAINLSAPPPANATIQATIVNAQGESTYDEIVAVTNQTLSIPYRIGGGGKTTLSLFLRSGDNTLLAERVAIGDIPPLDAQLRAIESGLGALAGTLKKQVTLGQTAKGTALETDRQTQLDEARAIKAAIRALLQSEKATAGDWQPIQKRFAKLKTEHEALRIRAGQAAVEDSALAAGVKDPTFGVGLLSVFDKLTPEAPFAGITGTARLEMAANEHESIQLAVVSLGGAVSNVTVTFSDLKGPDGTALAASNFRWSVVGYVRVGAIYDSPAQDYPDPLMEAASFSVPADRLQPVWVALHTPPDQKPGRYTGRLTVSNAQQTFDLPLEVEVWGFALPDRPATRINIWYFDSEIRNWYGASNSTPACQLKWMDFIGRYRIGAYSFPSGWKLHRKGGEYRFDFSGCGAWLEGVKRSKPTVINVTYSCNDGFMRTLFAREWEVMDDDAGKVAKVTNPVAPDGDVYAVYTDEFLQVYRAFLRDHSKYLIDNGLGPYLVYAAVDEADVSDPTIAKLYKLAGAVLPAEVKRTSASVKPDPLTDSLIEIYCPGYVGVNRPNRRQGTLVSSVERAHAQGKECWFYTSCESSSLVHQPTLNTRAIFWIAAKYRLDGFLNWGINMWNKERAGMKGDWPAEPWKFPYGDGIAGDGFFIYPGRDASPWSSIRLEALNDGIEDADYIALLRSLCAQRAKEEGGTRRVREALYYCEVADDLVHSPTTFLQAPDAFLAERRAIARQIVELKRPSGTPTIP